MLLRCHFYVIQLYCQLSHTRNVLRRQVHLAHIHAICKTTTLNYNSKQRGGDGGGVSLKIKFIKNTADIKAAHMTLYTSVLQLLIESMAEITIFSTKCCEGLKAQ